MAKTVEIARNNLQNLTNEHTITRPKRSLSDAKEYILQLDEDAKFPKIGLLVDRADIKNIALKIGLWSVEEGKKQILISTTFLAIRYFLIKKRC